MHIYAFWGGAPKHIWAELVLLCLDHMMLLFLGEEGKSKNKMHRNSFLLELAVLLQMLEKPRAVVWTKKRSCGNMARSMPLLLSCLSCAVTVAKKHQLSFIVKTLRASDKLLHSTKFWIFQLKIKILTTLCQHCVKTNIGIRPRSPPRCSVFFL